MTILFIATQRGTTEIEYRTRKEAEDAYNESLAEAEAKKSTLLVMMYLREGTQVSWMRQFSSVSFVAKKPKRKPGEYVPKKKHPRGSGIEYNSRHLNGLDVLTGRPKHEMWLESGAAKIETPEGDPENQLSDDN